MIKIRKTKAHIKPNYTFFHIVYNSVFRFSCREETIRPSLVTNNPATTGSNIEQYKLQDIYLLLLSPTFLLKKYNGYL